ncbi:lamin tail domain-containing protein [Halosimplex salinum]|uniref:lamin tail domain-containing protein n=1 Tax=Halosimplex salinum TaxID=1710538 RepID=UPI000F4AC883|nr:lamin tail domain-containing protein [Halosimplex salinum]
MERRRLVAVVAVAAVATLATLSGCAGLGLEAGGGADAGSTATAPDASNGAVATVIDVVDGDTIDVRYPDGSTDTVRLLGVDTPEVHADNDPAEYEGVPDDETGAACLEAAGEDASAFAERWLADTRVTLVVDPTADRRDRYGRLLAYVHVNASERDVTAATGTADTDGVTVADGTTTDGGANRTDFNYRLVATGHARVYDSTFDRSDRYYAAEADAQAAERGLWHCRTDGAGGAASDTGGESGDRDGTDGALATSDTGLALDRVHADAAGDDHENLNDEYVVFGNAGDETLALGGWTVGDEAGHGYTVPEGFALGPGETVTLRSGTGEDTADALYWGRDAAVWNNGGDTVVVERDGETVLRYTYD